jgi:hypothetical protein
MIKIKIKIKITKFLIKIFFKFRWTKYNLKKIIIYSENLSYKLFLDNEILISLP